MERLWIELQRDGYASLRDHDPASAATAFYLALVAFGHADHERALEHARRAATLEPEHPVYAAAQAYLLGRPHLGSPSVYAAPEAFSAFIRGGGNVPLYRAVSAALREVYRAYPALELLDVGVGDGRALLPALTGNVSGLTLVEPAAALLARAQAELDRLQLPYRAYAEPLETFVQHAAGSWDIAQATFSLQSIRPVQRAPLLRWLRGHTERLLIVEFDVPRFEHRFHPRHVRSVLRRFEAGIVEYDRDRALVSQGFLMPLMFGYFDRSPRRTNHEQPRAAWVAQLRAAGFTQVASRVLYRYWWAPAVLIDARP